MILLLMIFSNVCEGPSGVDEPLTSSSQTGQGAGVVEKGEGGTLP